MTDFAADVVCVVLDCCVVPAGIRDLGKEMR